MIFQILYISNLRTCIFQVRSHSSVRLVFLVKNYFLEKLDLLLILFYFKRENKTRNKRLKKCDSIVLEKHVFKKPQSRFGDQITY